MTPSRPAAVSGFFYTADPDALQREVETYLQDWPTHPPVAPGDVLLIPHAGYQYSASIAAAAYQRLVDASSRIKRVAIVAPAHRKAIHGAAISSAGSFATPLGDVRVDREICDALIGRGLVTVDDEAHADEHAVEVHLPFLQTILKDFSIVPIVVGRPINQHLQTILMEFYGKPDTVTIISTDLSHFLDEAAAIALDTRTLAAITDRSEHGIDHNGACGSHIINQLLPIVHRSAAPIEILARGTSADSGGPKQRVVGYASLLIHAI